MHVNLGDDGELSDPPGPAGPAAPTVITAGPTHPPRDEVELAVSVIIPTYRSGPELDRTLASLDAQTLRRDRFEVLLVDDGSPDGTYQRCADYARSNVNATAIRIQPSGWSSAPRNVGIEHARGHYVLFMDHDDLLGPRTLDAAYRYGVRHAADVVNIKESRTGRPGWGLGPADQDRPDVLGRTDVNPIGPMTPHKLYRRQLLLDHEIRFQVGDPVDEGRRVLGEDVYFNIDVVAHARTVAGLRSTDPYHWVMHDSNTSASHWEDLGRILRHRQRALEHVSDVMGGRSERGIPFVRVLLGTALAPANASPDAVRDWIAQADLARRMLARFDNPEFEAGLTFQRAAARHLLRTGREDLFPHLVDYLRGQTGRGTASLVQWEDGRLRVDFRVVWHAAGGPGPALVAVGDRLLADMAPELQSALPVELRDLTRRLVEEPDTELVLVDDDQHATWQVPTRREREIDATRSDGRTVRLHATAEVDLDRDVFGAPHSAGRWVVGTWSRLLEGRNVRRMRVAPTDPLPALVEGSVRVAERTPKGFLSLRVGTVGDVVRHGRPDLDASTVRGRFRPTIGVPLSGVHRHGGSRLEVEVVLRPGSGRPVDVPARVIGDETGVRLEWRAPALDQDEYEVEVLTGPDRLPLGRLVRVGRRWQVTATT